MTTASARTARTDSMNDQTTVSSLPTVAETTSSLAFRNALKKFVEEERKFTEEVLEFTVSEYYIALRRVLKENDLRIVFGNFVELWMMQRQLYAGLQIAASNVFNVVRTEDLARQAPDDRSLTIGDVFIEFRRRLTMYGPYCAGVADGCQKLMELEQQNAKFKQEKEFISKRVNWELPQLLKEPKKHLLSYDTRLLELVTFCNVLSEDFQSFEFAREELADICEYVNAFDCDFKLHKEAEVLTGRVFDLPIGRGRNIMEHGRLLLSATLRVIDATGRSSDMFVVLCEKALFICEFMKGNLYKCQEMFHLPLCQMNVFTDDRNWLRYCFDALCCCGDGRSPFAFELHDAASTDGVFATFLFKTSEQRDLWIETIQQAKKRVHPMANTTSHSPQYQTIPSDVKDCSACAKLFKGFFWQGYKCQICHGYFHPSCLISSKCPGSDEERVRNMIEFSDFILKM